MKFHKLKVAEATKLTPLSKKLSFEIPDSLRNEFQFQSGQYVNLGLNIDGKVVRRSYSICSPTSTKDIISVGVKEIVDPYASAYINQNVNKGDIIDVSSPEGSFLLTEISDDKQFVFVAGGSGITPILSMLHEILPNSNAKVYLKYSTLSQEETMFYNELSQLQNAYSNLKIDFLFTGGANILNENNIAEWMRSLSLTDFNVWVCGPTGIISATKKACSIIGLADEKFHREYFTAKSAEDAESAEVGSNDDSEELNEGEIADVEIKYEGKTLNFQCKYGETILDAALDAGGDPPYSCLVAACSTCRAMVKTGGIQMKDRDALSDKDIEKGFVLTCQSMPRTKKLVLDYDV